MLLVVSAGAKSEFSNMSELNGAIPVFLKPEIAFLGVTAFRYASRKILEMWRRPTTWPGWLSNQNLTLGYSMY